jgi:hypothetical protein
MTKYEIILYWSDEDGAFIAEVPELPGCAADGPTKAGGPRSRGNRDLRVAGNSPRTRPLCVGAEGTPLVRLKPVKFGRKPKLTPQRIDHAREQIGEASGAEMWPRL